MLFSSHPDHCQERTLCHLHLHSRNVNACPHERSAEPLPPPMIIVRKTSITITNSGSNANMPISPRSRQPQQPTWDVLFTVKSTTSNIPDWHPTQWTRSPLQKIKFLQAEKQKTDAIRHAAQALSSEIPRQILTQETDNIGRASPSYFASTYTHMHVHVLTTVLLI